MLCVFLALAAAPGALGKEGVDQYPYGAENWLAGVLPPPGLYFLNYFGYYSGQLRDGSGGKVNLGGSIPSVDAVFDAPRLVAMTKLRFLGASVGMHVTAPFVRQSMEFGGRKSRFGLSDISVSPLILAWHGEHWHAAAGVDLDLPTGAFNKLDPRLNMGAHYVAVEPVLAVTTFWPGGWETSAKMMYNVKTTNSATDYHSGSEFHADYAAGKHIRQWSIGASGYALTQLTNDTVGGRTLAANPGFWNEGRKGQALSIGPSVSYSSKKHVMCVVQWQHEVVVRNRFGGDKVWFKLTVPL
jgi:hypothetical protein